MGVFYAFLSVLFFIVSHSQVKSLSHFAVEELIFFRALGILLFSIPFLFVLKQPLFGVDKKNLFLRGLFGTIAIFCYFLTLQNLPLAHAVVLQQMSPLFAVLFASLILKERSQPMVFLFFGLALFGVLLIKGPLTGFNPLYLFGLLSAAFAALAYNFVRKLKKTDHPLSVLTWFQYVLLPTSLVVLLVRGSFEFPAQTKDIGHILFLILFSFLAQVCLTLAYQTDRVDKVSIVNYLSIPLSLLVGYFFYSETLNMVQVSGIALIFLAVLGNALWSRVFTKKIK